MLVIKVMMALGGACAFLIMDKAGYKVGHPNGEVANLGLLAAYIGAPLIFHLSMACLAWNFPITSRKHGIIQRRLEARARRLEAKAATE